MLPPFTRTAGAHTGNGALSEAITDPLARLRPAGKFVPDSEGSSVDQPGGRCLHPHDKRQAFGA